MPLGTVRKSLLSLSVNGVAREFAARPHDLLLDLLREELGLTGTRRGCDMGTCGCCAVHLDGRVALSCLVSAWEAEGREITTVEGLRDGAHLHPIQRGFEEAGGSQCGFCTAGFLMTAADLLDRVPDPDEGEIRRALAGNLCRCTGYVKIVLAVKQAAALKHREPAPV